MECIAAKNAFNDMCTKFIVPTTIITNMEGQVIRHHHRRKTTRERKKRTSRYPQHQRTTSGMTSDGLMLPTTHFEEVVYHSPSGEERKTVSRTSLSTTPRVARDGGAGEAQAAASC